MSERGRFCVCGAPFGTEHDHEGRLADQAVRWNEGTIESLLGAEVDHD
jgi:hypothetical protein